MARTREGNGTLKCSFCGKSQNDVRKLIAGPTVYICDECIELCNDIIVKHTGQSLERVEKDTDRDFFMGAPEAKLYGLIDEVVVQKKPSPPREEKK